MSSDEPDVEREARDYLSRHSAELRAGPDGGPGSGECFSASAAVLDLGVALTSLGRAGGTQPAGQVTFDPAACLRRIVVYVVMREGAWVAIGAIVYDRATQTELSRIGEPAEDFDALSDTDTSSGEFF